MKKGRLGSTTDVTTTGAASQAYGETLLSKALEEEARRRRHGVDDLAASLGIHTSHWYRLRADPRMFARCERATHESVAEYLRWPIGRVLLASGVITQDDFAFVLGGDEVINGLLKEIEKSQLGAVLRTPLKLATRDHQMLIAEIYCCLKGNVIRTQPKP